MDIKDLIVSDVKVGDIFFKNLYSIGFKKLFSNFTSYSFKKTLYIKITKINTEEYVEDSEYYTYKTSNDLKDWYGDNQVVTLNFLIKDGWNIYQDKEETVIIKRLNKIIE